MIPTIDEWKNSTSKSPWKPTLVVNQLKNGFFGKDIEIMSFTPLGKEDFLIAHTEEYVNAFFEGKMPLAESNQIPWSIDMVRSVCANHGSFYSALEYAITHPNEFCVSPVSGFHHAKPDSGGSFCTFSGQVISSVKIFQSYGARGAYFDLDGHYGNSIDDSKSFQILTSDAIAYNINIKGNHQSYIEDLKNWIDLIGREIASGNIQYLVWNHGADSHEDDDYRDLDFVNTREWLRCTKLFFNAVADWRRQGFIVPVVSTLFGGYRKDNFHLVLDLHVKDIEIAHEILNVASVSE